MKAIVYPGSSAPAFVEDAAFEDVRFDDDDRLNAPGFELSKLGGAEDEHTMTLAEYWRIRCGEPLATPRRYPSADDGWSDDPYDDFTIDAEISVERMAGQHGFTVAEVAALLCINAKAAWARISRGALPRPAHRGLSIQNEESRFSAAQVVMILARRARKAAGE